MHVLWRSGGVFLVAVLAALGWISSALAQDTGAAETIRVNVIACVDPDCADTVNIVTMEGATVTSYHPDGSMVDSCTVSVTPSGMSLCTLIPIPDRGSYDVRPTDAYVGYDLLSSQPEVFESEMHGAVYVWYFAPPRDNVAPPPTQAPAQTAPVTELPSTGSGGIAGQTHVLAIVAFSVALVGMGSSAVRRKDRD